MSKLYGKKGIESYIIILLIFSAIITSFMVFILSVIYGEEHIDCKLVNFEIQNSCKDGKAVSFKINNIGSKILNFELNDISDQNYFVIIETNKQFSFIDDEDSNVIILPYLKSADKIYYCSGKSQSIDSKVLIKC